jgi:hypothetical protein
MSVSSWFYQYDSFLNMGVSQNDFLVFPTLAPGFSLEPSDFNNQSDFNTRATPGLIQRNSLHIRDPAPR